MMNRFSLRERLFLLAGGLTLILTLLIFGILLPYQKGIERLDRKIVNRQEQLGRFDQLRDHYLALEKQQQELETKLTKGARFSLFSFIEKQTTKIAAKDNLTYVRPQQGSSQDGIKEDVVEIKLESLGLNSLVKLLYAIEHSGTLLQVQNLRIKPRFDDQSKLDITMQVAAFRRDA